MSFEVDLDSAVLEGDYYGDDTRVKPESSSSGFSPEAGPAKQPAPFSVDLESAELDEKANQGFIGTLADGAKSAGRAISSTYNTYTGDGQAVVDNAKAQELANEDKSQDIKNFQSDWAANTGAGTDDEVGLWGAIKGTGKAIIDNPRGAALSVVEQFPNSVPALAAGWAGAKGGAMAGGAVGSAFGGVGAGPGALIGGAAGFVGGMFLGNTLTETGHKAQEYAADGEFTPDEQSAAITEGAKKAGVITAVDALTFAVGGKVSGYYRKTAESTVEAATRKTLLDAGVDISDTAALTAARGSPQIASQVVEAQKNAAKIADNLRKRAGEAGALLTMETVGEGLGEYLGELAATGQASVAEAVLESFLSLGQSGVQSMFNFAKARERSLTDQEWIDASNGIAPEGMAPEQMPVADGIWDKPTPEAKIDMGQMQGGGVTPTPVFDPQDIDRNLAPTPSQQMGINPDAGPLSAAAAQSVDSGLFTGGFTPQAGINQSALEREGVTPPPVLDTDQIDRNLGSIDPLTGEYMPAPEQLGQSSQAGGAGNYEYDQWGNLSSVDGRTVDGYGQNQPRLGFNSKAERSTAPLYEVGPDGVARPSSGEAARSRKERIDLSSLKGRQQTQAQKQPAAMPEQRSPEQQAQSIWDSMNTFERNAAAANVLGMRGVPAKNAATKAWDKLSSEQQAKLVTGLESQQGKRWIDPNQKVTDQTGPVLQNRDRTSQDSINQMRSISNNPDYSRLKTSGFLSDGAPVVVDENIQIPASQMGVTDTASAGNERFNVQYAVVEADQLMTSNSIDGTTNAEYQTGAAGKARAIAGNGRITGLQSAWAKGNASQYKADMAADRMHGIDPAVIEGMRNPVLVRLLPQDQVTDNIGDLSNRDEKGRLSPVEQAKTDMGRIDLDSLKFTAEGAIGGEAIHQFRMAQPAAERVSEAEARKRLTSAVFQKAYGNDQLTEIQSGESDDAKSILSALAQAAPSMSRLEGAGEFDIRPLITQAGIAAVNAARRGTKLADYVQQSEMGIDPMVYPILEMMLNENGNIRSSKYIGEQLTNMAKLAYDEANSPSSDMFGEKPKRTAEQVIQDALTGVQGYGQINDGRGQESLGQRGRSEPDAQMVEGPEGGRERPADTRQTAPTQPEAEQEQPAAVESNAPETWRSNYIQAAKIAREKGINPKQHKKLADLVEAIDASNTKPEAQTQLTAQQKQASGSVDGAKVHLNNSIDLTSALAAIARGAQLSTEPNGDVILSGTKIITLPKPPTSIDEVIAPLATALLEQMRADGVSMPGNPADMTRDQFAIAYHFANIIPEFEISGADIGGVVQGSSRGLTVDSDKLYDKIIEQAKEQAKPALELNQQTEESLAKDAKRLEQLQKEEAAQKVAQKAAERKQRERDADKARADEVVDDFQLGQSAEEVMSGMGDIFATESKPADKGIASQADDSHVTVVDNQYNPNPTEAQKQAGNYKKAHVKFQGLDITVENPVGSVRSGVDPDGNTWSNTIKHDYGYIKRTKGADGDHVDVFIGKDTESDKVFVIDQPHKNGKFDEHKIMLGFKDQTQAVEAYKGNYQKDWKVGSVTEMTVGEFKQWLSNGDTTKPVEPVAKPAAQTKPSQAIEDFGERLEGARKDYASKLSDAKEVDIATEPLSKSWPEPNYQKLIDGGMPLETASIVRAIRDEIPVKPRASWRLKGWVRQVSEMRDLALNLMGETATAKVIVEQIKSNKSLSDIVNRADLYSAVGHDKSLKDISLKQSSYSLIDGVKYSPPKELWTVERPIKSSVISNMPRRIATAETREQAIAKFKNAYATLDESKRVKNKAVEFGVYTDRTTKDVFIGRKVGKSIARVKTGFETAKDAIAHLKENYAALEERFNKMKDTPDHRKAENSPRVGVDHRNGADVTPEQFSDTFGFRGVQFGNYVEQGRRQQDLNEAYDALMDMAGVLGIPAKSLSLNGELGLAFGARGKGGKQAAKAHYEPDQIVINLTKKNGAGSLAHEWWHALDNYFGRERGGKSNEMYASDNRAHATVRPEMAKAYRDIASAVSRTKLKFRSDKLDRMRTKPYWGTGIEMTARSFESYVIEKLRDSELSNDYLANIVGEDYWNAAAALGIEKDGTYPYPEAAEIPEIRAAYDNFFNTLETKEGEDGNVLLFSFAGKTARGADLMALDQAQLRIASGDNAETVRQETGWHRGDDGKWRFEISDDQAKLRVAGKNAGELIDSAALDAITGGRKFPVTSDLIDHAQLFVAYPKLSNIKVEKMPEGGTALARLKRRATGFTIQLRDNLPREKVASAILHELQHGIQVYEGFAVGGSKNMVFSDLDMSGAKAYRALAGEVEARNTQTRHSMTPALRRNIAPELTQDTPSADVIVTFNGKDITNKAIPNNVNNAPITDASLVRAFDVQFPRLTKAVRTMLARGNKGERGGVVVIDSADPLMIARAFAKKTGKPISQSVQMFSDAGVINGFFDPKSGLTFLVGPNLNPVTGTAVLLHEMIHGQQRQKIDKAALAMLMNRGKEKNAETRAFLDRVAARMDDAGETANAQEAGAYIVEQAVMEGKSAGYGTADSRFLSWVDQHIGKTVGDFLRSFIGNLRSWALRNGLPIGPITVDDLVSYAMAGMKQAGRGNVDGGAAGFSRDATASLEDALAKLDALGLKHRISERNDVITVSKIEVPEGARGQGAGSSAMQALIDYADATGKHIALTPTADFGGNKARLKEFYQRFGFKENKGKNKVYEVSEGMVRENPNGRTLYSKGITEDLAEGQRQFAQTENAYGGRAAYDQAKSEGKTKLNYQQWVQVRTPAFKNWFGDWENESERVERKTERVQEVAGRNTAKPNARATQPAGRAWRLDPETGEPRIFYHGTKDSFTVFDLDHQNRKDHGWLGTGIYTGSDKLLAESYARLKDGSGEPRVMEFFANVRNPYKATIEDKQRGRFADRAYADRVTEKLKEAGYDGVVLPFADGSVELVAFDKPQIKSATGNVGTFSADNDDIRFSFAGQRSGTADHYSLGSAQQRIESGENAEAVRQDTGWHKGIDGKWRYEISDHDAKLRKPFPSKGQLWGGVYESVNQSKVQRGEGYGISLGEILDHPALFAAYPHLASLSVSTQKGSGASYESGSPSSPASISIGTDVPMYDVPSKLLHEIQHGIQNIEGFARGGTLETGAGLSNLHALLEKQKNEFENEHGFNDWIFELILEQPKRHKALMDEGAKDGYSLRSLYQSFASEKLSEEDRGYFVSRMLGYEDKLRKVALSKHITPSEFYQRLAGEVEARNTQIRHKMTAEQRKSTPPSATQDVSDADAIVMFNGTEMHNAPAPANTGTSDIRFSRSANPASISAAPNGMAAWDSPSASKFDDFVYKMQDKHVDTKRVIEAIRDTGKAISDDLDVYLQETLFHGRAAKRTQDFLNKEVNPLIEYMQSAKVEMSDLEEFLHARHAQEANALIAKRDPNMPDGGSGMTNAEAAKYLNSLNGVRRKQLENAAKFVDKIIGGTRETIVSYGLESQETVDGWTAGFKHYIPLQREDKDGQMGIGQGFSVKGKETKGRTGSTRKVVDILANVMMQRERAIVRGEKNRVAVALLGLAKDNPLPEFWQVDKVPTTRVLDKVTGLVRNQADPMYKSRDNAIVAKVNGQEHAILMNEDDPRAMRMAEALKNLDAAHLEGLLGATATATRYFAAVNTQYNPIFGVTNFVRDIQEAMLHLQSTPLAGQQSRLFKNTFTAVGAVMKAERDGRKGNNATGKWGVLWEDFQNTGGQTGFRDQFSNSADRGKEIQRALTPDGWAETGLGKFFTANGALKAPLEVVRKKAAWLFDLLSDYNTAMENGVRLSAYETGINAGMSKEQAAALAKGLTVNFNRKGQVTQQVGALYAFFNASVQGTARLGQSLFDMDAGKPKTLRLSSLGKKIVSGGVMLGASQAVLLAMAGFDDEEPPEFIRERNIIIPTGGKTYISIPMPLGYHVIANLGRIPMEFVLGGGKDGAKHLFNLMDVMADIYNPIGNSGLSMQTIAPTVLDPLAGLAENKDFSGRAIAKESFNRQTPGHALARDTASLPATWLAELVNYATGGTEFTRGELSPTPDQIDYLVGQLTGGVGRETTKFMKSIQATATGDDLPWHNIPLVGRFFGDADSDGAKQSAFYNSMDKVRKHAEEVKGLRASGRSGEAVEYANKHPHAKLHLAARAAEKQVKDMRDRKRDLEQAGAPREEIRALEKRMVERMEQFVELAKAQ
ncbi:putative methyltransferase [Bacillus phage vB_BspP_Dartukuta]|nr:putative methyltransferase [Bacillus phage vB_BspP_Dartukuta]